MGSASLVVHDHTGNGLSLLQDGPPEGEQVVTSSWGKEKTLTEELMVDWNDTEEEEGLTKRRWSTSSLLKWFWLLLRLAWKHSMRHSVMFCLGVVTLLMLVFMMTLLVGVTAFAPGIISHLVETDVGQSDLIISNRREFGSLKYAKYRRFHRSTNRGNSSAFLNFTAASEKWDNINFRTYAGRLSFSARVGPNSGTQRWRTEGIAFDTEQEKIAGIGKWDWPAPSKGSCYISKALSSATSAKAGDEIEFVADVSDVVSSVVGKKVEVDVAVTLVVGAVIDDFGGKFPRAYSRQVGVMLDLDHFEQLLRATAQTMDVDLSDRRKERLENVAIREYCTNLHLQIPSPRTAYLSPDIKVVRGNVLDALRPPVYEVDFRELSTQLPVLSSLNDFRFLSLFLGLLVDVALVVFVVLAWVILYSLFSYSVDTRNYEVGVLRVVGMGKIGIVELVIAQVMLIGIPSWILGLAIAQAIYSGVLAFLKAMLGISGSPWLSANAIGVGTILGLVVPALAAVLPLRRAISYSPAEAFAKSQNRKTGNKVEIRRENVQISGGVLLISIIPVVLGFALYYLFPLALISLNISLLLLVFMLLLVCMLLGLCLFFMNLDRPFMLLAFWTCFWWENPTVKRLVRTNFVAHRGRNRKTFLMYNLTIALVIYLDVITRSQILYLQENYEKRAGGDFAIVARGDNEDFKCCREEIETKVAEDPAVASFTWISKPLRNKFPVRLSNIGKSYFDRAHLRAVLPGYEKISFERYTSVRDVLVDLGGMDWSEHLYSAAGSQQLLLQSSHFDKLGLEHDSELLLECGATRSQPFARLRPAARFGSLSGLEETKWSNVQPALVSFPSFLRLSCGGFNSLNVLPLEDVLIRLREDLSERELAEVRVRISRIVSSSIGSYQLVSVDDEVEQLQPVGRILELGFILINALSMAICCFSLITSVYANQFERATELATLRALGLNSFGLFRVTFAEASCLLLTSCLLGVLTGFVMALTQSVQHGYFVDLPLIVIFPWLATLVVIALSAASALLAALVMSLKGRKHIAGTLRRVG